MKSIITFIKDFHANSGSWIASATLFNKLILFLIKSFILLTIEKEVYGQITYSITVIAFFSQFVGLGSASGMLRYGAIAKTEEERHKIINYSFSQGLLNTMAIMIMVVVLLPFLPNQEDAILLFTGILVFRILGLYLNVHQSAQLRVDNKNKLYGQYDITYSITLLIFTVMLTYLFGALGYLIGLISAPIITFLIFSFRYGFPKWNLRFNFNFTKKSFWSYSFLSNISGVVSQTVFFIDIYLIGNLLGETQVAEYSAAALIPMNILLLPIIFIRTDFTKLAANYKNRTFLKNYYFNFLKLFAIIISIGMLIAIFFGEWIFSFLGKEYSPYELFLYLMVASSISILFRVPLGNMFSAFGRAKVNTIIGSITLILSIFLNLILIPKFGLIGAAWATCICLIISSILNVIYFFWYLKNACD
ncbi:oligosaccharide flippase family protein [Flavobacteriaceae bacterium Ap0902]|nr:oligosaccharide flippase family protein [Flavobacteriaceae bacterium Ap0902]